jgi:hypothetical protein
VPRLTITHGPRAGELIEVDREVVIGRVGADVVIEDAELSRRHLLVRPAAGALELEDLGSTNGTFVDDRRIQGTTRVGNGARVRLGATTLEVSGVAPAPVTRLSRRPGDLDATRARDVRSDVTRARPSDRPASVTAAGPAGPQASFSPPLRRHGRGLASRSWVPVALSFGTVILTAVALVIYFAAR